MDKRIKKILEGEDIKKVLEQGRVDMFRSTITKSLRQFAPTVEVQSVDPFAGDSLLYTLSAESGQKRLLVEVTGNQVSLELRDDSLITLVEVEADKRKVMDGMKDLIKSAIRKGEL